MPIPQEHEVRTANQLIKLSRYLITKADSRGLTHGEKHYLLQTVLQLLREANGELGYSDVWHNEVTVCDESDIPF